MLLVDRVQTHYHVDSSSRVYFKHAGMLAMLASFPTDRAHGRGSVMFADNTSAPFLATPPSQRYRLHYQDGTDCAGQLTRRYSLDDEVLDNLTQAMALAYEPFVPCELTRAAATRSTNGSEWCYTRTSGDRWGYCGGPMRILYELRTEYATPHALTHTVYDGTSGVSLDNVSFAVSHLSRDGRFAVNITFSYDMLNLAAARFVSADLDFESFPDRVSGFAYEYEPLSRDQFRGRAVYVNGTQVFGDAVTAATPDLAALGSTAEAAHVLTVADRPRLATLLALHSAGVNSSACLDISEGVASLVRMVQPSFWLSNAWKGHSVDVLRNLMLHWYARRASTEDNTTVYRDMTDLFARQGLQAGTTQLSAELLALFEDVRVSAFLERYGKAMVAHILSSYTHDEAHYIYDAWEPVRDVAQRRLVEYFSKGIGQDVGYLIAARVVSRDALASYLRAWGGSSDAGACGMHIDNYLNSPLRTQLAQGLYNYTAHYPYLRHIGSNHIISANVRNLLDLLDHTVQPPPLNCSFGTALGLRVTLAYQLGQVDRHVTIGDANFTSSALQRYLRKHLRYVARCRLERPQDAKVCSGFSGLRPDARDGLADDLDYLTRTLVGGGHNVTMSTDGEIAYNVDQVIHRMYEQVQQWSIVKANAMNGWSFVDEWAGIETLKRLRPDISLLGRIAHPILCFSFYAVSVASTALMLPGLVTETNHWDHLTWKQQANVVVDWTMTVGGTAWQTFGHLNQELKPFREALGKGIGKLRERLAGCSGFICCRGSACRRVSPSEALDDESRGQVVEMVRRGDLRPTEVGTQDPGDEVTTRAERFRRGRRVSQMADAEAVGESSEVRSASRYALTEDEIEAVTHADEVAVLDAVQDTLTNFASAEAVGGEVMGTGFTAAAAYADVTELAMMRIARMFGVMADGVRYAFASVAGFVVKAYRTAKDTIEVVKASRFGIICANLAPVAMEGMNAVVRLLTVAPIERKRAHKPVFVRRSQRSSLWACAGR